MTLINKVPPGSFINFKDVFEESNRFLKPLYIYLPCFPEHNAHLQQEILHNCP